MSSHTIPPGNLGALQLFYYVLYTMVYFSIALLLVFLSGYFGIAWHRVLLFLGIAWHLVLLSEHFGIAWHLVLLSYYTMVLVLHGIGYYYQGTLVLIGNGYYISGQSFGRQKDAFQSSISTINSIVG